MTLRSSPSLIEQHIEYTRISLSHVLDNICPNCLAFVTEHDLEDDATTLAVIIRARRILTNTRFFCEG
jgi:hypothetical protein